MCYNENEIILPHKLKKYYIQFNVIHIATVTCFCGLIQITRNLYMLQSKK